jgi:hypothetical protein
MNGHPHNLICLLILPHSSLLSLLHRQYVRSHHNHREERDIVDRVDKKDMIREPVLKILTDKRGHTHKQNEDKVNSFSFFVNKSRCMKQVCLCPYFADFTAEFSFAFASGLFSSLFAFIDTIKYAQLNVFVL